jgi:glycosyltransferase involved in cell wall biosynthesis
MNTFWYDVTDTHYLTVSAGTARVERELRKAFRVVLGSKYKEFYVNQQGQVKALAFEGSTTSSEECCFSCDDVVLTTGILWCHPKGGIRIDVLRHLKQLHQFRLIGLCHDLIPELIPQWTFPDIVAGREKYIDFFSDTADLVLCISKSTEQDLIRWLLYKQKHVCRTAIVTWGDNQISSSSEKISDRIAELMKVPYILCVSTLERRKNHEILYKAYRTLAERGYLNKIPNLLCVGRFRWGITELLEEIKRDPLVSNKIYLCDWVNENELFELYRNAKFCVYPSLYEGWGLPIPEALSMGKTIIAADNSSLREAGKNYALYVNAWDVNGWAETILNLSNSEVLLANLNMKSNSYVPRSWLATAKQIQDIIMTYFP